MFNRKKKNAEKVDNKPKFITDFCIPDDINQREFGKDFFERIFNDKIYEAMQIINENCNYPQLQSYISRDWSYYGGNSAINFLDFTFKMDRTLSYKMETEFRFFFKEQLVCVLVRYQKDAGDSYETFYETREEGFKVDPSLYNHVFYTAQYLMDVAEQMEQDDRKQKLASLEDLYCSKKESI